MQNKLFLKAADICELLEVKQTSAYEIIGNLNKELEEQGYLTLRRKVPTKYFVKRFYGVEDTCEIPQEEGKEGFHLEYFAAECDEFHDMGDYEKSTDVNQIAAVYEKYRENPENAYRVCSMGIIYRDPEDSFYDEAEFSIVKGNRFTVIIWMIFDSLENFHSFGKALRRFMKHYRTINMYPYMMSGKPCIQRR